MQVLRGGRVPIYSWARDLEAGAVRQARSCADLPVADHHVAVMADGHPGYGVPIGAVLALLDAVAPYAVGNDIGCGMAIVPTTISRDELLAPARTRAGGAGPAARDEIMGWVQSSIPSGRDAQRHPTNTADVDPFLDAAFDALTDAASTARVELSTSRSAAATISAPLTHDEFVRRGRAHAGTLGAGNHFIELLADPTERIWVMVHSGSRGVGSLVCNNFHRMALTACSEQHNALPDPGLAWLPTEGTSSWAQVGRCYEQ